MLHWIWKFILGIVVGLLARMVLPGAQHMGLLMTGLLGVIGSYAGHGLAHAVGLESGEKPSGRVFSAIISIAGAVLILFVGQKFIH
ncbi:MAG TPA: hypothetical protein VL181_04580 [Holophagaceae bacterium]|nr:hypothetical protein [Holophagaceae bacterium]